MNPQALSKMYLYHGTSTKKLDKILEKGIEPRGRRKSVWAEFPSHPDRVYLTNAYAIWFAMRAVDNYGGDCVVFKVDVSEEWLMADEDALAQANWTDDDLKWLNNQSLQEKTLFWKEKIPEYPWLYQTSLEFLGNCTHNGVVMPHEIEKYVVFEYTAEFFFAFDPNITLMNYRILGERYRKSLEAFVESDGKKGRNPQEYDPYYAELKKFMNKHDGKTLAPISTN
tara:strand:+ start:260 stop:934 length:675 start_codon:yes stop_codon:yes gene_type:complete